MHLLILTPQFPFPPHQGTTLRNYNLLAGLAARHTIDLFSLLAPGDDPGAGDVRDLVNILVTAPQPVRPTSARLRSLFLSALPDMALRLWNPEAFAKLAAHYAAHPPQAVQVEGIEMAPYLLALQDAGAKLPIVMYDAHNAETLLQRRAFAADLRRPARWPAAAYSAVQTLKLGRYERRILLAADGVAAVSEADAEVLRRQAPGAIPEVVTNGVDLVFYDPALSYPNPYAGSGSQDGPRLVFTGKMDFRPNVDGVRWFVNNVLPQLRAVYPALEFWIVGRNPHPRLRVLEGRPGVVITGAVPDIRPYLAHAQLNVVPLLAGGGTRLKILEALAMARPVVSTRLGAEGFPVVDGTHLALADTAEDFAGRCLQLLAQPEEAEAMGRRGRAFVAAGYSWSRVVPRLEHLYLQTRRWSGKSVPAPGQAADDEGESGE